MSIIFTLHLKSSKVQTAINVAKGNVSIVCIDVDRLLINHLTGFFVSVMFPRHECILALYTSNS